jgi:hypothetical protein
MIIERCPWCNGSVDIDKILLTEHTSDNCTAGMYEITCSNENCLVRPSSQAFSDKKEAIHAWNTIRNKITQRIFSV